MTASPVLLWLMSGMLGVGRCGLGGSRKMMEKMIEIENDLKIWHMMWQFPTYDDIDSSLYKGNLTH